MGRKQKLREDKRREKAKAKEDEQAIKRQKCIKVSRKNYDCS